MSRQGLRHGRGAICETQALLHLTLGQSLVIVLTDADMARGTFFRLLSFWDDPPANLPVIAEKCSTPGEESICFTNGASVKFTVQRGRGASLRGMGASW
jgi:hypothetical protein